MISSYFFSEKYLGKCQICHFSVGNFVVKMNNSYIGYFKNRSPIRFLTNVFRNYKKLSEQLQVDIETCLKATQESLTRSKHKTNYLMEPKVNIVPKLPEASAQTVCSNGAQQNIILNLSKKEVQKPTNGYLSRKCGQIDLNIKEKLEKIPIFNLRDSNSEAKHKVNKVYPWQNFNVDNVFKPKYKIFKPVSNVTREILNMKKPILKKSDTFKPVRKKEVKFNKTPTFMVYPKLNSGNSFRINSQPRINLSTNSQSLIRDKLGDTLVNLQKNGSKFKMKPSTFSYQKYLNTKQRIRYFPREQYRFLYYNEKPKFYS